MIKDVERKQNRSWDGGGVGGKLNFLYSSGGANIHEGVRYGSNSIIASQENLGRLARDFVSLYFLWMDTIRLACKI